jgi:hypothetical protein
MTYLASLAMLVLAGCATMPNGPTVRVLPAPGKTLEQFQSEDVYCRQWAGRQLGESPQEAANRSAAKSAAVGTVLGAGVGAALGAVAGNAGAGAAIGGGTGLLFGGTSGANASEVSGREAQRLYDNAYVQCMYAKGNQVPGIIRRSPDRYPVPPDYRP